MKRSASLGVRVVLWGIAVAIAGVVALSPAGASAAEVTTQTLQLLPPGAQTCAQPSVSGFTPYVYGNALNSFEFLVSDPSYVAILGSVGGTPVGINYMTRFAGPAGSLKVHVDTPSTPVHGSLEVVVTLLSPGGGGVPVCALTVRAVILGDPSMAKPAPSGPAAAPAPAGTAMPKPVDAPESASDMTTATGAPAAAGVGGVCPIQNIPALWVILLALYALLVAALVLGDNRPYLDVGARATVLLIVLPFLAILGVWYAYVLCRVDWAPFAAFAVGAVGLAAAYKNDPNLFKSLAQS
jgi:hypothetical protein